jgi:hypothetical protein
MSARLPSDLLVTAMLRRVQQAGGYATVLAKGDAQSGSVLVIGVERGADPHIWERGFGPDGRIVLIDSTPPGDVDEYWRRRRARDPDLWVIELDIPNSERFAAETMLGD